MNKQGPQPKSSQPGSQTLGNWFLDLKLRLQERTAGEAESVEDLEALYPVTLDIIVSISVTF